MRVLLILVALFIALTSCLNDAISDTEPIRSPETDIEKSIDAQKGVKNSINENTDKTIKEAEGIKGETDNIKKKVPNKVDQEINNINESANNIIDYQKVLKDQSDKLSDSISSLERANILVVELVKVQSQLVEEKKALKKDNERLEDERQKATYDKMMYLVMASIICIALCIVSALRGETKAIWGAVGAGIVMILALSVSFYSKEYSQIGIVAVIAGLALACYLGYNNYVDKKFKEEMVDTVEMSKGKLNMKDKVMLYGEGAQIGAVHSIQSESTKKMVDQIRSKHKRKWEHTINYKDV
jgi:hypothetical protein